MPDQERRATPRRDALIDTAAALFYSDGIRTVGVDRLVAEAHITKATFYKHFPARELLVRQYISARIHDAEDAITERIDSVSDPRTALQQIVAHDAAALRLDGFRGDALLNAATEHPDSSDPVRQAITRHRTWLLSVYVRLLDKAGHPAAKDAARDLLQARDGAMMAGITGEPAHDAAASLQRALHNVLGGVSTSS